MRDEYPFVKVAAVVRVARGLGVALMLPELPGSGWEAMVRVAESSGVGWIHHRWLASVAYISAFRVANDNAAIAWCPDFGLWPENSSTCGVRERGMHSLARPARMLMVGSLVIGWGTKVEADDRVQLSWVRASSAAEMPRRHRGRARRGGSVGQRSLRGRCVAPRAPAEVVQNAVKRASLAHVSGATRPELPERSYPFSAYARRVGPLLAEPAKSLEHDLLEHSSEMARARSWALARSRRVGRVGLAT